MCDVPTSLAFGLMMDCCSLVNALGAVGSRDTRKWTGLSDHFFWFRIMMPIADSYCTVGPSSRISVRR